MVSFFTILTILTILPFYSKMLFKNDHFPKPFPEKIFLHDHFIRKCFLRKCFWCAQTIFAIPFCIEMVLQKWSADHFYHTILHNGLSPKTNPPDQFHIVGDHLNWPGSRKTVGRLEPVDYLWRMIIAFCLFCVYLSDSYPDLPKADLARLDKIRYVGSHVIIIHVQYA